MEEDGVDKEGQTGGVGDNCTLSLLLSVVIGVKLHFCGSEADRMDFCEPG